VTLLLKDYKKAFITN